MPEWKTLKLDAKAKIKAANPSPYMVSLIFLLISFGLGFINSLMNSGRNAWLRLFLRDYSRAVAYKPTLAATLFSIILSLMLSFVTIGFVWYSIKISRRQPAALSNLFDAFRMPLKVLSLSVVRAIFILLWSVLLFIPGIVASYRYSQAFNILYDHPDYGVMQCISESKRMMNGYKAELFGLDFSFIGWVLLSVLTLGILFIWLQPYMQVTRANFYNALCAIKSHSEEPSIIST